jgi:SAM-dependent methyltransferase
MNKANRLTPLLLEYMELSFRQTMNQVYSAPSRLMEHPAPRQAILFDCGCGDGVFSQHMAGVLGVPAAYGVEVNRAQVALARQIGVRALCADINQGLPLRAESVDVFASFNVLEHLVETQRFISEMYRVLRPGGYGIINTPNLASWHNIAALVLGLQPFSGPNITSMTESDVAIVQRMHRRAHDLSEADPHFDTSEPERHRHIVVVAFRSLLKALERAGFTVEQALGYGSYPLPPFLAWVMSRIDPAHAHHMVIKVRKPMSP